MRVSEAQEKLYNELYDDLMMDIERLIEAALMDFQDKIVALAEEENEKATE